CFSSLIFLLGLVVDRRARTDERRQYTLVSLGGEHANGYGDGNGDGFRSLVDVKGLGIYRILGKDVEAFGVWSSLTITMTYVTTLEIKTKWWRPRGDWKRTFLCSVAVVVEEHTSLFPTHCSRTQTS
ncbi:unnamed protein product, partial [Hapterophycus canaliculatus]